MNQQMQQEALYSIFGDDPDLADLVEMFVDEMPGRVDALRWLCDEKNWTELERTAHQIKGAAGSYGFDQLTPYAARLESLLASGEQTEDRIREACDGLIELCRRVRAGAPA